MSQTPHKPAPLPRRAGAGAGLPSRREHTPGRTTLAVLALAVAASVAVSGCAPAIFAAGMGAGVLVAADRRSAGAQIDDEAIELKIVGNEIARRDDVHINATSFNGQVLLTGETPTPAQRAEIERVARATDRVRSVQNEIVVGPASALGARTNDTYITSKVKARLVEARKFARNHVKVVTERGVVYLMGLVKHDEAEAATQIAATTTDVVRVVKVFEYIQ